MKRNGLPCLLSQQPWLLFLPFPSRPCASRGPLQSQVRHVPWRRWKESSWPRFHVADVQKKSDADLTAVITDGKAPKMPSTGTS